MNLIVRRSGPLHGRLSVPGDKSITHRAIILATLAEGKTLVRGWVPADVCLATLRCMRSMGAQIEETTSREGTSSLLIRGLGIGGLQEPEDVLHCAGSGTTIRLLAGVAAGQSFLTILTGTEPLRRRPMGRVAEPLRLMGANVAGRTGGKLPPLAISGGNLAGIDYSMPVASAQVKSAILLAGLFARGETVVREPGPSRDHTERMLRWFGVEVVKDGLLARLKGGQSLHPPAVGSGEAAAFDVPGDFSSAAFPMVASSVVPGSDVVLERLGVNATRTGLADILSMMGAELAPACGKPEAAPRDLVSPVTRDAGEPILDLHVRSSDLRAVAVGGELVVRAIDEFPIFAVAATQAAGTTELRDAGELRVKESDRIATVATELRKMGADVEERQDGMLIRGPTRLRGALVESHRDHRLAMALAVAGMIAEGTTIVQGAEAVSDSFPGFVEAMQALGAPIEWSAGNVA